jgi:hypothetical protein
MTDEEYRDVRRSHVLCWVVALLVGIGTGTAAHLDILPRFGTIPAAGLGAFVGLVLGNKFFPDGQRYLTFRAKNYRRAKRGLPPIEDTDPVGEYFSDIDRG